MTPLLKCELSVQGSVATIVIDGELAHGGAQPVFDAIGQIGPDISSVVFDLTDTSFVDSTGLRTFIAARQVVQPRGGHVTITNPPPACLAVLELTGLDEYLVIAPGDEPVAVEP